MRARLAMVALMMGLAQPLLGAGCLGEGLTRCADGTACPSSLVCDTVHGGCVLPSQLASCAGQADLAPCEIGGVRGACFGEVCLPAGCGNGQLEPEEACDDGNTLGGDGCAADCLSQEVCGNGLLDRSTAEECDDGNLRSHDGCSSRCASETWRIDVHIPGRPSNAGARAVDERTGRIFLAGPEALWALDGATWSVIGPARGGISQLLWDDRSSSLLGVASSAGATSFEAPAILRWDGAAWSELPGAGVSAPRGFRPSAYVFDGGTGPMGTIFGLHLGTDESTEWRYDLAQQRWTFQELSDAEAPASNGSSTPSSLAFDRSRGEVIAIVPSGSVEPHQTWARSNLGWEQRGSTSTTEFESVFYNALAGQLWMYALDRMYAWDGAAWAEVPGSQGGPGGQFVRLAVGADLASARLVAAADTTDATRVATWTPTGSWQPVAFPRLPVGNRLAVDSRGPGRVRLLEADGTVWARQGAAWQIVAPADPGPTMTFPDWVFDPGRQAFVVIDEVFDPDDGRRTRTRLHDGTTWLDTVIEPGPFVVDTISRRWGLVYDWSQGGVVVVGQRAYGAHRLDRAATSWLRLPTPPTVGQTPSFESGTVAYAFDRNRLALSLGATGPAPGHAVFDLEAEAWVRDFAPQLNGYRAAGNPARQSYLLVQSSGSPTFERRAEAWLRLPALADPTNFGAQVSVPDAVGGGTYALSTGQSPSLLWMGYSSGLADDLCAGDDDDGDGAVDCADPDCWWSCTPTCPPGLTCP